MDRARQKENRLKTRFTYALDSKLLERLKIMAIKKKMKTNELLDEIIEKELAIFEQAEGTDAGDKNDKNRSQK